LQIKPETKKHICKKITKYVKQLKFTFTQENAQFVIGLDLQSN